MGNYNYTAFSADHYALDNFHGPKPGTKAPDFEMQTVDGGVQNLLDFEGGFLVLELGSITCPLFQSRRPNMEALGTQFPDTSFAILYVREAHPGDARPQHVTQSDKLTNASALKNEDAEGRLILIDDIDGTAHKAYGSFPNAVFIINRNGCVLYVSDWNNPNATGRALKAIQSGNPAGGQGIFLPAVPKIGLKTLKDAGKGAGMDFLRSFPTLVWKNLVKRNLRILLGKTPAISPDMEC